MKSILPAPEAAGFGTDDRSLEADVCIVGAGPGGSATAKVLAEAGLDVVVVEEGPKESRFQISQANSSRYHMQEAGTMVARGPTPFLIAAGRGVGGGSLINSALCFRTPDEVLAKWDAMLDADWSPETMGPVFEEIEALIGVGLPHSDHAAGKHNVMIAEAARRLGYEGGLAARNTPGCVGCGACNFGCPVNGKATVNLNLMARAVLAGARIQAETKVTSVDTEGDRVVGVTGRMADPDTGEPGGTVTVRARHTVLSCGAVGTPRLLHHCGLGGRMDQVGQGLLVHPGSAVLGRFDEVVDVFQGATQGCWFEDPELPGVLPHTWTSPPEVVSMLLAPHYGGVKETFPVLRHIGGVLALVSDHGHGSVGAYADGRANIAYAFDAHDVKMIQEGMILCAKVLLEAGATELYAVAHGVPATGDLEVFSAAMRATTIRDFTLYSSHPMCTCRMGRSLDGDGRALGLEGLSIHDASVFPTSLGVNPQLSTMAVSTVLSRRLAETL